MRPIAYTLVALLVVAGAGCDEALSDLTGPTRDLRPTFSSIQRDIFEAADSSGRPACTGCHNAATARFAGGLDLSGAPGYANLVNATSPITRRTRVVPGDPDSSYLIQKLEGASGIAGGRMPLNGPYLSSGQIQVIRRWIETGAADD